jgi:hypothetical protein
MHALLFKGYRDNRSRELYALSTGYMPHMLYVSYLPYMPCMPCTPHYAAYDVDMYVCVCLCLSRAPGNIIYAIYMQYMQI